MLNGGAGNDTLTGLAGDDTLIGGSGVDSLAGGLGNDTYVVDTAADAVDEKADEGSDTLRVLYANSGPARVVIDLGSFANFENLEVLGAGLFDLVGTAANNRLVGNSGANAMTGGLGDDTYVVDHRGDTVIENDGEGADTVQSGISFTLGDNVENLTLTGSAAINGTGNAQANVLIGNAAANRLDGGAGADTLTGGAGNDTYLVDDSGDTVTEGRNQGTDLVQSGVSFTLGDNVENLILTGNAAINGTGNALANVLTGNTAANRLDGGAGADTLIGGAGDDTYVIDNGGDRIVELNNVDNDRVESSISYTLGGQLEQLELTGDAAINGTGNALANTLTGNAGNNVLNGGAGNDTLSGGDGTDRLSGGAGADLFVFNSADALIHPDTIIDFISSIDRIALKATVFDALGPVGTTLALGEHLTYDNRTGALAYDADGVGGADAVTFATLGTDSHPATLGIDFFIIA